MMKSKKVEFSIAMNSEEKKAGNVEKCSFVISFVDVPEDDIRKAAIANQVVGWQSQIRNNWDKFIKGELPKVVTFGQPLFDTKRVKVVTKPVTDDDVADFIGKAVKLMNQQEIMEFASTGKIPESVKARM